jgi:GntR family transcriptional regulator, transcriptional repressor for pyruvate dehydrogenase complex
LNQRSGWSEVMTMKLLPVQKRSLSESIAQQLRRNIFAGLPQPGSKLPPERELAESLGTNRNTLREAIRSLESLGLVSVRVTNFRAVAQLNLLPYYLLEHPLESESLSVLEDILMMRRTLLALAAHRVAQQRDEASLGELRYLLEQQQTPSRSREEMLKTDLEFFACLIRASGSLVMRWLFNSFVPIYDQILEGYPELWIVPDNYLEFLGRVVASVEAVRPDDAHDAVLQYFESVDVTIVVVATQLASQMQQSLGSLLALER